MWEAVVSLLATQLGKSSTMTFHSGGICQGVSLLFIIFESTLEKRNRHFISSVLINSNPVFRKVVYDENYA